VIIEQVKEQGKKVGGGRSKGKKKKERKNGGDSVQSSDK
jgi:hypothetical protein